MEDMGQMDHIRKYTYRTERRNISDIKVVYAKHSVTVSAEISMFPIILAIF